MNPQAADPFDLNRFIEAQQGTYEVALAEIQAGHKRTHWMWYIFPQVAGLAFSSMSQKYAIKSVAEANAYLRHPILGPRLIACAQAALAIEGRSANQIFGSPDDLKLKSSATLFAAVSSAGSVFEELLEKHYGGARDERTLKIMEQMRSAEIV